MPIKFENLKFAEIMKDYATILEVTIPEAVRINARLLAVEFSRRTQPFGFDDKSHKQGQGAIAKDLLGGKRTGGKGGGRAGIFAPLTPFMEAHAELYDSGNIRLFVKKDGSVYGTDKAHFMPGASMSTLRGIHKGAFVNGRMSAAGGDTRDIGRWKFINKYLVPPTVLDAYVTSQQAKVGIAKSGWAQCAKSIKNTRNIPSWVTKHLGNYALGNVEDRTANKAPTMVLTNTCRYASDVLPTTQQLEGQNIVAGKMKKQMTKILKYRQKQIQEEA